jgi:hypothetical protein
VVVLSAQKKNSDKDEFVSYHKVSVREETLSKRQSFGRQPGFELRFLCVGGGGREGGRGWGEGGGGENCGGCLLEEEVGDRETERALPGVACYPIYPVGPGEQHR